MLSEWTYTDGIHYWGGWVGFLCLLVPTFICNAITFILVTYSPRLNQSSSSLMVRYLSIEDGLFSLCCLISCALNLSHMQIYGDFTGCEIQAIYALFFMLASGYTLCCIAYNSEQKISFKPGLTARQVFIIHIFIWIISCVIAFLSSLVLAPARIMPSSTYCLVSLLSLQAGLSFYIPGVGAIGAFLSHRYWLIYKHVTSQSEEIVSAYAQQKQASQKRQIKVAKRMFIIVCAYFICALPVVVISIYEEIVNEDAPAIAHIVAGHMVHVNSLLNPILYVWMNSATRAALWELFGYKVKKSISINQHAKAAAAAAALTQTQTAANETPQKKDNNEPVTRSPRIAVNMAMNTMSPLTPTKSPNNNNAASKPQSSQQAALETTAATEEDNNDSHVNGNIFNRQATVKKQPIAGNNNNSHCFKLSSHLSFTGRFNSKKEKFNTANHKKTQSSVTPGVLQSHTKNAKSMAAFIRKQGSESFENEETSQSTSDSAFTPREDPIHPIYQNDTRQSLSHVIHDEHGNAIITAAFTAAEDACPPSAGNRAVSRADGQMMNMNHSLQTQRMMTLPTTHQQRGPSSRTTTEQTIPFMTRSHTSSSSHNIHYNNHYSQEVSSPISPPYQALLTSSISPSYHPTATVTSVILSPFSNPDSLSQLSSSLAPSSTATPLISERSMPNNSNNNTNSHNSSYVLRTHSSTLNTTNRNRITTNNTMTNAYTSNNNDNAQPLIGNIPSRSNTPERSESSRDQT